MTRRADLTQRLLGRKPSLVHRLLGHSFRLALVVALAIIAGCTWANTIGALVPLIAQKVGLDPTLVSALLITTLIDATGDLFTDR